MNNTKAAYIDNSFGPPSELVNVAQFIQSTSAVLSLPQYPPEIADQCSVADIHDSIADIGNDAQLMAHLIKTHELAVASLYMAAEKAVRNRKRPAPRDAPPESAELLNLQSEIEKIPLDSWKLPSNSAIFIRPVKNSDNNTLIHEKSTKTDDGRLTAESPQAVITVTVHNKLSWRQTHVSRSSRHALLSSQTLGDLFETIPCTSNEITDEILQDGRVTGYKNDPPTRPGCVICIEGFAYGDGENEIDYADKLIQHLQTMPKDSTPMSKAPASMFDTTLASLSLRVGEPYWLLHHGNCEHFIVVDQIRLQHPTDPPAGYPLTLQITPPLLDVCRGCAKVPAVWSVVNDERLGESPCPLCGPCWTAMGDPRNDKVIVAPFPKYELGW